MNASSLFILLALPSLAQSEGNLRVQGEKDTLAIAEQLYAQVQAPGSSEPQKQQIAQSAAALFEQFIKRYPKSAYKDRARYFQAACLLDCGQNKKAQVLLAQLAQNSRGDYAAAAAYKLGLLYVQSRDWDNASGYFAITKNQTTRATLRIDALYRLGQALTELKRYPEAIEAYRQIESMPEVPIATLAAAQFALAQIHIQINQPEAAYKLLSGLLALPELNENLRGQATLQAARLSAQLGKSDAAQDYYERITHMDNMHSYQGEAQLELLLNLYRSQNYAEIVRQVEQNSTAMADDAREATRCLIVGQSLMEMKRYSQASSWFESAELKQPYSKTAIEAAYRRILCSQIERMPDLRAQLEKYLKAYPAHPLTSTNPINDMVRLLYANLISSSDMKLAAQQYDAIKIENLPEQVHADTLYRKAWTAAQSESLDPLPALDAYIEKYTKHGKFAEALALRGMYLQKQKRLVDAMKDFKLVMKDYAQSETAALCWQRAAQISSQMGKNDDMVMYYQGLIDNYPKVKPEALAEAYFNIGRVYFKDKTKDALKFFMRAKELHPERYASAVDLNLVQCYFKLRQLNELNVALKDLAQNRPNAWQELPEGILRWCGWMCYLKKDYGDANFYLSEALARSPVQRITDENGVVRDKPQVEMLVWKSLAHSRLHLQYYEGALYAVDEYLAVEKKPYGLAEGLRDKALILVGLGKAKEAVEQASKGIELGVDGPLKSELFLALGDAHYSLKDYLEAAKFYGRTANVVSDKELKPVALYKTAHALIQGGKRGEAKQYELALQKEFADWQPSERDKKLIEKI